MIRELQSIGQKYGTDKSGTHQFNGVTFLDIYEKYFNRLKESQVTLLEIGVLNGASIRTWKEYFNNCKVVGLDIDPSKKIYESNNVEIFIGSQDDGDLIDSISKKYSDGFDIIIDDGSHINSLTISSFNLLFKHVKKGGIYIIEDTHCTYGSEFWELFVKYAKNWPGMSYNNSELNYDNKRSDFDNFLNEKIKKMDGLQGEIKAIHFYPETLVIEKIN